MNGTEAVVTQVKRRVARVKRRLGEDKLTEAPSLFASLDILRHVPCSLRSGVLSETKLRYCRILSGSGFLDAEGWPISATNCTRRA